MLSGNDGGVWVTWDSGRNWRHLNNIAIGQFYEIAYDFQKPYHVCGGLQDNYSWCGPSASLQPTGIGNEDWITVQGGDGFYARIDPVGRQHRLRRIAGRQPLPPRPEDQRIEIHPPAGRQRHRAALPLPVEFARSSFRRTIPRPSTTAATTSSNPPIAATPGSASAKTSPPEPSAINSPSSGKVPKRGETLSLHDGVVAWPCITAIAESPVRAGVLYAGTDDGNLQVSRDGGKTWSNVASHMPGVPKGAYVSRIETSHKEEGTVYVTFDNHRSGDFAIYIYASKNHGDSWTKITNGIPVAAGTVHVIREDPANPNLLFAGTEFGLFVTFNRGQNWERLKNGLPTVPVFDLQIHPRDHDLILATHGRSIWIMDNITALEEMAGNDSSAHHGPAPVHAETRRRMEDGQLPRLPGKRPLLRRQSAGGRGPGLLRQDRRPGPCHREGQGRQRCSPVDRTRRSQRGEPHRVGHALRRPHPPRRADRLRQAAVAAADAAEVAVEVVVPRAPRRGANAPAFAAPETGGGGPGEPGAENSETAGGAAAEAEAAAAAADSAAIAATW